jgi:hypothetical protein
LAPQFRVYAGVYAKIVDAIGTWQSFAETKNPVRP